LQSISLKNHTRYRGRFVFVSQEITSYEEVKQKLRNRGNLKKYTEGLDYESFIADDKTVDAVIRNFEIIGEAANRIDSDFHEKNP
jgi:uncharacterized protein with HEPN domain